MKVQFAILFFSALAFATASPNRRIVGGSNVLPGQIPHQVSLTFFGSGFHFAGGALLSERWVVSVANYLAERAPDSIGIVVGVTMLTGTVPEHQSDRIEVHFGFNRATMLNNIAMVRSRAVIPLTIFVMPVALGRSVIPEGVVGIVSGFGATRPDIGPNSNVLQSRPVETVGCESTDYFDAMSQHLCAEAAICTIDVGGPLTHNNELIGLALWHHPLGCGGDDNMDFYVRITSFVTWITNFLPQV